MAKFELNIYGNNDEIIKSYATDRIRYGVLMKALELQDKAEKLSPAELMREANALVKTVFAGLTDDELYQADMQDVFSVYQQITAMAGDISSDGSKN